MILSYSFIITFVSQKYVCTMYPNKGIYKLKFVIVNITVLKFLFEITQEISYRIIIS